MPLFIAVVVSIVVAQTWLDWRDAQRQSPFPQWSGAIALAGLLGAALTGATSVASSIFQDSREWANGFGSNLFWPQFAFLLCTMGIVVLAVRKRHLRVLLILAAVLFGAIWMTLHLLA